MSEREHAVSIVRRLREAGHEAYFAGGSVRDLLLGSFEAKDYDIATSARPEEVMTLFRRTVAVGEAFGVVCVLMGDDDFDVATFRVESDYADHRHPNRVEYADARADALRRDFTINGMFYDPIADEVIDFVGGRADLEAGIIRTIGDPDERFDEDHLRLLRAVRFANRFQFDIEPATLDAIRRRAADIRTVSPERIRDEFMKILAQEKAGTGLESLRELGLLAHFLPEALEMVGVEQPPAYHPEGDVWTHSILVVDFIQESDNAVLKLGAFLHDVGKPRTFTEGPDRIRFHRHPEVGAEMADVIGRRLRLSNEERETVVELVRDHMRFMHVKEMRTSTLKRFLRRERIDLHLDLHQADCRGSHGKLGLYEFCREKRAQFEAEKKLEVPTLLTGHDLIEMGYRPGPTFGQILTALEDAQLEGDVETEEEARRFVKENWPE